MGLFNTPLKVVQWRVSCGRAWLKECPPRHAVVIGIITEAEHVYCAVRTETLHIIRMYILILGELFARSDANLPASEVKRRAEGCI
jgi:hypothetical protein